MFGLTLGVQYYFNVRAVTANAHMVVEREQAIMAGVALALKSLRSEQYLDEIIGSSRDTFFSGKNGRVKNILVLDDDGNVRDSLVADYVPGEREDKSPRYVSFKDVPLPPLRRAARFPDEQEPLPACFPHFISLFKQTKAGASSSWNLGLLIHFLSCWNVRLLDRRFIPYGCCW